MEIPTLKKFGKDAFTVEFRTQFDTMPDGGRHGFFQGSWARVYYLRHKTDDIVSGNITQEDGFFTRARHFGRTEKTSQQMHVAFVYDGARMTMYRDGKPGPGGVHFNSAAAKMRPLREGESPAI